MIKVNLHYNNQGDLERFDLCGHAEYSAHGQDIVCAAVSMIVINTINAIESFTKESLVIDQDAKKGHIACTLPQIQQNKGSKEAILLLKTMVLGLEQVKNEYGEYIQINIHQGGE